MNLGKMGFTPIRVRRKDDPDGTTLFNILGEENDPAARYSIGGMRCQTPPLNTKAFYASRAEPPATLAFQGGTYWWRDICDAEVNVWLDHTTFTKLEPTPPARFAA